MNRSPLRKVAEHEIETFDRDGVVHVPNAFGHDWVERMRAAVDNVFGQGEQFMKLNPEGTAGLFYVDTYMWTFNDDFRAFAFESPAAEIAATLLRSKRINLITDAIFHKKPRSPHVTPWHQDQPYFWVDGWQACGFWIALDHITLESGAVEYIRGSHKSGIWYEPTNFDVTNTLERYAGEESEALKQQIEQKGPDGFVPMPDFDAVRDQYDIVSFETEPGDCIVNHFLTVHSAPGNPTDRDRKAVAFRFAGDDTTFAVRQSHFRLRPFWEPGLKPGDSFPPDHSLFPQVWPRMEKIGPHVGVRPESVATNMLTP